VAVVGLLVGALTAVVVRPAGTDATAGPSAAVADVPSSPASARTGAPTAAPTGASPASSPDVTTPAPTAGPSSTPTPTPTPTLPPGLTQADVDAGLRSTKVATSAGGRLVVVPGSTKSPGIGTVHTVRVEVEKGLPVDGEAFAAFVLKTLNDPRGWGADGSMSFRRTDGDADLRVVLASPDKVDEMCAPLKTAGEVSCGREGHATINFKRWVRATPEFDSLTVYRQYVVSHEVGHLLGHAHEHCPGAGELAPVMQQQSYQVAPCRANAWPHPEAKG